MSDHHTTKSPGTALNALFQSRTSISRFDVKDAANADSGRIIEASLLPLAGSIGEKYLKKRGLADAAPLLNSDRQPQNEGQSKVLWNGDVAFCPRFYGHPALVFALRDFNGAIVSLHGRYIEHNQPKSRTVGLKKYAAWASPNAWNTNYVPAIILTEAPLDALSLAVAGFRLSLCAARRRRSGYIAVVPLPLSF